MRLDDFVNVVQVNIAVPSSFRIDHSDRSTSAAIQATCLVDPDLPWSRKPCLLHQGLATVITLLGLMLNAAVLTTFSLVQTKKDVAFVIGWCVGHRLDQLLNEGAILGFQGAALGPTHEAWPTVAKANPTIVLHHENAQIAPVPMPAKSARNRRYVALD